MPSTEEFKVLDMSVYDNGKITQPCWDVIMSFCDKGEAESVKEQIVTDHKKAETLDSILPFLRKELTAEQLELLMVVADPLSMKILAYLASEKPKHTQE